MIFDFDRVDPDRVYQLMTQAIIPRPVAWILTGNITSNSYNLAPFSYFSMLCHDPAVVSVSFGLRSNDEKKDTLKNLERSKECVIHIAPSKLAHDVTHSAYGFDFGESEVEALGLPTSYDIPGTTLPRIIGPKLALYGRLQQVLEIGRDTHHVALIEIHKLFCEDDCIQSTSDDNIVIDALKVDPILRLGGAFYGTLGHVIDSPRAKVKPTKRSS